MDMNRLEPLRGVRILIVEDEALIAEELRVRLSRCGAQIVGVLGTAAAAADTALETRPDVMLMDIRLRGRNDGIDAVHRVRQQFAVAVVYLTALSDQVTLARARDAGICAYVTKPFEERQLVVAIEMAIEAHQQEIRRSPRHSAE